ncbi:MAG: hypothetical protein WDZ91_01815 [Paenibacillaceae bacterium]
MENGRKERKMITKTYKREEIISFGSLRNLSQKDVTSKFSKHNKLGIIVKDELKYTIVDTQDLESLIEENELLKKRIEEEDIYLSYQDRLLNADNPKVWNKLPDTEEEFINLARKNAGLE